MKLKVCGMKYNTAEVATLQPDYLGFIFYEGSKRNYVAKPPELPHAIKKVGIFVDADIDFVIEKVREFQLNIIQLHGDESAHYCALLRTQLNSEISSYLDAQPDQGAPYGFTETDIWKVFSIKDTFNFSTLSPYENSVDAFLFDTKGKEKGGNGYTFNWDVLKEYPSEKPFVLSGGIGLNEISAVRELLKTKLPILAIDVNSKFETEPGKKHITTLKKFIDQFK